MWMSRTAHVLFANVTCTCATIAIIVSGRSRGRRRLSTVWCTVPTPRARVGAHLQPRSRIVHQHAPLVYRLGFIVLAWPSPLCPPLVGASDSSGVKRQPPDHVVRRCHRALHWTVPNDAG